MKQLAIKHDCKGPRKRRKPTTLRQEQILADQGNRCFYCGLKFYEWYLRDHIAREREVRWDHISPYAYSFNSNNDNFVAACQDCNGIKAAKVFETLDDAAEHVRNRRLEKGLANHAIWGNRKTRQVLIEKLFFNLSGDILETKPKETDTIEELENKLHQIKEMKSLFRKLSCQNNNQQNRK